MLKIDLIRTDGGTQARSGLNEATVEEYAEQMRDPNTVFPPVIVYHDGKDYWLADGFHRLAAWRVIGRTEVPAEIRMGTRRDAILHACQANSTHGLRRTNADKRKAVEMLLRDPEWSQWSDREIARRCRVSQPFVSKIRAEITASTHGDAASRHTDNGYQCDDNPLKTNEPEKRKFVDRHGNETVMRVDRIGDAAPQHTGDIPSEASNSLKSLDPAEEDPLAPFRKGLSALTREGLEDEVAGLRAENAELRQKVRALEDENARLKERIKWFEAEDDLGRKLGLALRQRDEARGRSSEYQRQLAREKRIALMLQKKVSQLEAKVEELRQNQWIELN